MSATIMAPAAAEQNGRPELLEKLGRSYGDLHLAIAWTSTNDPERGDPKKVLTKDWDKTKPLADGDFGAGFFPTRGKTKNPAVVLRPSNLVGLECDTEEDLERIESLGLPRTMTVVSSLPFKRHFWFRPPAALEVVPYVAFRFESGKLSKDTGRYLLLPPALHPSGAVYSFLPEHGPDEVEIAELPEDVYRTLCEQARQEDADLRERIQVDPEAKIRAGNRRDYLFRYGCMLRRWGLRRDELTAAVHAYNEARCEPPVERHLVEVQIDGAMKKTGGQEIANAAASEQREEAQPSHSWTPIDLLARASEPPEPATIGGIAYPGRRHVYSGEPESLKSMVALILCYEEMKAGRVAMYVNLEMADAEVLERLRQLGADDETIRERFVYLSPDEPLTALDVMADVRNLIEARRPSIIVVDSMIGLLTLHECDPNSAADVERFYLTVDAVLGKHGAGIIYLDHVTKDKDTRGKFAIGSERKIGRADVHLSFETVHPFGRGRSGLVKLTVKKDRPGHLPRPGAAEIELRSDAATGAITYSIRVADKHQGTAETGERFRPTVLMERVSRFLEGQGEAQSRTAIVEGVRGNTDYKRTAIDVLLEEGFAVEESGLRDARLVRSVLPFRQGFGTTPPTTPNPAHHPALGGVTDDPASPPFSLTGEAGVVGGVGEVEKEDPAHTTPPQPGWLRRALEDSEPPEALAAGTDPLPQAQEPA